LAKLIAGHLIRQEAQQAFLDGNEAGYRLGLSDGMAIEAEDQARRAEERGTEMTPEPHDACQQGTAAPDSLEPLPRLIQRGEAKIYRL
jgi:hypothetical protein